MHCFGASHLATCAGLELLQRLLAWPSLLLPTVQPVCDMLADAMSSTAATLSMPACCRAALYRASAALMAAMGQPAAEALAPELVRCAWVEFYVKPTSLMATVAERTRKRARTQQPSGSLSSMGDVARAAAHAQRPGMRADVAAAQVCSSVA
jgi:hypothetical protein